KTENPHRQFFRFGSQALQLIRGHHAFEGFHQRGQRDGQLHIVKQPAQVFQRVGHALQEMLLALVKTAKTIRAEGLHDADVYVGIVKVHELGTIDIEETSEAREKMIEQLLAQIRAGRPWHRTKEKRYRIAARLCGRPGSREKTAGLRSELRSELCAT